jgi:Protein of unknown function (DUF3551)
MRAIFASWVLLVLGTVTTAQAGAWCAWYGPYTHNCGFRTLDQCRATISGDSTAWCSPNPQDDSGEPRRRSRNRQ